MLPLVLNLAHAEQDAVSMKMALMGQESEPPRVEFIVNQRALSLDVRIDCGGPSASFRGPADLGRTIVLQLPGRVGSYECRGHLKGEFADGSSGEMPLSFDITILPPMKLDVPKASVDLVGKRFELKVDRIVRNVSLTAYGKDGSVLGTGSGPAGGPAGQPIEVTWSQMIPGDVVKMVVKVEDAQGFWVELDLYPWSYAVPHDDVVFETGRWDIRGSEEPKLEEALRRIDAVRKEYAVAIPINLFIAGYTDTVGDAGSNESLSRNRARAIAQWFQAHGFQGEIHYQGFGERALAVGTPDEVDEVRNRRATYIVAAESPAASEGLPGTAWSRL